MVACPACLDDLKCWVCLSSGVIDSKDGPGPCHRCYGSGVCASCQTIKLADIQNPPLLHLGPFKIRRGNRGT